MSTAAQVEANRLNARKSTGPKSEEGKAASARNATKHGFYSASYFVPDDELDSFASVRDHVLENHPVLDALCEDNVLEIVHSCWNLHRLYRLENQLYAATPNPFADPETLRQLDALRRHKGHFERALRLARKDYAAHATNLMHRTSLTPEVAAATPSTTNTASFYDVFLARRKLNAPSPGERQAREAEIRRIRRENEERTERSNAMVQHFIRTGEVIRDPEKIPADSGQAHLAARAKYRKKKNRRGR